MSTVVDLVSNRVPEDKFSNRLALVRTEMGWNYDQAQAATGINSETWRLWEKGKRRCTDIESVSATVSRTTGYSYEWLMVGGPLALSGHHAGPESVPVPRTGWTLRRRRHLRIVPDTAPIRERDRRRDRRSA